ncbi:MAG TPA: 3-oxoacyl-[acyl-carrier-protein] reductase [Kiritimatiellia bacterium]|mgnify:CR=1 FL=1|nr:3-oxoacyl-[acyl-carrier-protein] reductase [Kiritimatiellia bacterium]HMO99137.1 3-oxoacyl-[acyl-carrier-protein] reductase [Kiritimatiellia bacterium]HMP95685.1 3-oxoacyl-[acyl-carrier-protein] reductase [Kiritimatiellia bacterium]
MTDLQGKIAIVTGASGGIGQAVAVAMAEAGADVAICGQNQERLAATAEKVAATGRRVQSHALNISQAESVQKMVEAVQQSWGRIDIMVNNAGITRDGLIIRMSEQDWDEVMAVNLKSVFLCSRAVARIMMKQRAGAIINISSIIGLIGNPGQGNYSASKGGIISFTKSIARELASRNIRANAIAPGFIATAMTEKIPEDLQKKMLDSIPLGRYGKPEDVADLAVFLAGDRSSYITGQVISICGGMVMQ